MYHLLFQNLTLKGSDFLNPKLHGNEQINEFSKIGIIKSTYKTKLFFYVTSNAKFENKKSKSQQHQKE